uniref:Chemokine like factor n=1 Tax=Equus caballus TaxID=9796 RepID=F6QTN2_HORSE
MQPVKLKSKHRSFCFSVKGHVKMLRLALTVTSMTFFILAQAPEPYIVITGFEVTVIFFFIILYMLRLDRVIDCLFWPLLDIINSLVTAVFMIVISVLALMPETTTFTVLGGGLLIGALACFITAKAHEWYIAVTILEILIVLYFILSYMLTLHHL